VIRSILGSSLSSKHDGSPASDQIGSECGLSVRSVLVKNPEVFSSAITHLGHPHKTGTCRPCVLTLSWPLQVWNFEFLNATQGQVYGNVSAAYETLVPQQNNSVYLGILVRATQNNIQPLNITINGQQCTLQLVNNITGLTLNP